MRRTLINGLLGGLLLHTIMPANAAAENSGPEVTEAMILDFLQRVLLVAQHDDLADQEFIERTLNGKFRLVREGEAKTPYEKSVMSYWRSFRFVSKNELLLQLVPGGEHSYVVQTPLPGVRSDVTLDLSFNFPSRGTSLEPAHLIQVFGKPMYEHHRNERPLDPRGLGYRHTIFAYRWEGRNSTVAQFEFSGRHGAISRIEIFQNIANSLKHYPL